MHLIGGAAAVIAPFIVAGCFATASATVGTISECGPGLDAAKCRSLAQIGLNAYAGPVLGADNIAVNVWASCSLDGVETMSADAAKDGVTCYSVYAQAANSGVDKSPRACTTSAAS